MLNFVPTSSFFNLWLAYVPQGEYVPHAGQLDDPLHFV